MEKAKQEQFGTKIKEAIDKLNAQLAESDPVADPVSPDSSIGRLSRVDAMQQQEMRLAIARNRRTELSRLESALKLIDAGEYGTCLGCGEDIPDKRLEAVPDARMCVPCISAASSKLHLF
jgi:DnaK suppressor protein